MKRIIFLLFILFSFLSSFSQSKVYLRGDSVYVQGAVNSELILLNGTRDSVGGVLFNKGHGRTGFKKSKSLNDSTITIGGDTVTIHGTVGVGNNAITKSGDTIQLGGDLNKLTFIRENLNRRDTNAQKQNFVFISNVSVDSANALLNQNNTYERANLYLYKLLYNNDTLTKQYGGVLQGVTRVSFDSTNSRFNSPTTPLYLPYGGADMVNQVFPPDTAYVKLGVFGQSGNVFSGDVGIGGDNRYYLNLFSGSTNVYPWPVYRAGFDYARVNDKVKREIYGNPTAGYVWDWRDYQSDISSGTTNYGSYIGKNAGFVAHGTIYPHLESPSKAKTLSVATVDTSIAFLARPMWTSLNEVKNGYAFVNEGTSDYNYFAGQSKFGGTMPSVSNTQGKQVRIDSTLQIGSDVDDNSYNTFYWSRNNITPTNFSLSARRGTWNRLDISFDRNTDIRNTGTSAIRGDLFLFADTTQYAYSSQSGVGLMGANFGLYLRKKSTGYVGTTTWTGGPVPTQSAAALTSRMDFAEGAASSTNQNIGTGWFSSFAPNFQFNPFNTIDNGVWVNIGIGQFQGTTNITNGYGVYINGFPSQVTNKYAIYQSGTSDTNYFKGKIKVPNLESVNDSTLYKPLAVDALGNFYKSNWAGGNAYNIYTALLTQSGTSAPTATVLGTNTIGSIVWTRSSAGVYVGTLSSAFTSAKTWLNASWSDDSGGTSIVFRLKRTGNNTVELFCSSDGVTSSDVFSNLSIEIRVYP